MSKHAIGKKFHSQSKFIDITLFSESQHNGTKNYIIHLPCHISQHCGTYRKATAKNNFNVFHSPLSFSIE